MSTNFTIGFQNNYIEVQHDADYEITPENQRVLWQAISEACKQYNCLRVLTVALAAPRRRMSSMDAFESAVQAMQAGRGLSVACCFPGYVPDETTEFFKTVAHNRDVSVEFFSDKKEALKWLGATHREKEAE